MKCKIKDYEENAWLSFASDHQSFQMAWSCFAIVSPEEFWAITAKYPDLVCWFHVQIRMMGWLVLNGGLPWLFRVFPRPFRHGEDLSPPPYGERQVQGTKR